MKIGKYPVKHSYKLARIICDVLSLAIAYVILNATLNFFKVYKQTINRIGNENLALVYKYGYSLAYRQYFAWIFPGLVLTVFGVYLILVLKSHRFEKYSVTKQSAQAVYDWYAFAVSLCKLPLLLGIFDIMYIFHQRMMFNNVSLFSFQLVLDALIIAIIIRLSVHRIRALTRSEKTEKATEGGVKAKIVDEPKELDEDKSSEN